MRIFLAGASFVKGFYDFYRLESYLTAKRSFQDYSRYKDFILDSGLFSYLNGKDTRNIDWEKYVAQYADFVRENRIKNYVEVDADKIVGYDNVRKLRNQLEKRVGWKSMPVWHVNRGYDEWLKEIKEYPYVCFGAFLTDGISEDKYRYIPKFLKDAEETGCKVHGLGFSKFKYLPMLKFYSVDSSTWQTGGTARGYIHIFKDGKIVKIHKDGCRLKNDTSLVDHNFYEWVKFSQYADIKL